MIQIWIENRLVDLKTGECAVHQCVQDGGDNLEGDVKGSLFKTRFDFYYLYGITGVVSLHGGYQFVMYYRQFNNDMAIINTSREGERFHVHSFTDLKTIPVRE